MKNIVSVKKKVLNFICFVTLYNFLFGLLYSMFLRNSINSNIAQIVIYSIAVFLTSFNIFNKTIISPGDFNRLKKDLILTNLVLNFFGVLILLPFGRFSFEYFVVRVIALIISSVLIEIIINNKRTML